MREIWNSVTGIRWVLLMLIVCSETAFADSGAHRAFEAEIFATTEVSRVGIERQRFNALSMHQRIAVEKARRTLSRVFIALQSPKGNPMSLLSSSLRGEFLSKERWVASFLSEEATILSITVLGFEVDENASQVRFEVAILVSAEEMVSAHIRHATVVREDLGFRLSSLAP